MTEVIKHTLFAFLLLVTGCGETNSVPFVNNFLGYEARPYLYVVSGNCYGGGATVSTGPTNSITRFSTDTGLIDRTVIDYNQMSPGDSPVSISDFDKDHLLVLVENTSGRRIDRVKKDGTGFSTYLLNSTALNGISRSISLLQDLSLLVSKSSAIEKFNSAKSRILSGANPFISAPGLACATSTTLISSVIVSNTGKIIFTHAAASPNNKINVISSNGYSTTADCLSGTAGPTTTAFPTKALLTSGGKLLVAFGSATTSSNFIYSYDFNESTGAITNPLVAYSNTSVINGPSALTEDPMTNDIFISSSQVNFNTVERFKLSGGILSKSTPTAFIPYTQFTRCVADLKVMR